MKVLCQKNARQFWRDFAMYQFVVYLNPTFHNLGEIEAIIYELGDTNV